MKSRLALCALSLITLVSCSKGDDQAQQARVERGMKAWLALELQHFRDAAAELQRAAPTPHGRGWSAVADADAISRMKAAWGRARQAYELVEGAVAPMFPDSDTATDARYDDFMAALGASGDAEPFDDRGVVGVHAIERVLWADSVPREAVEFESRLPGYRPAAFPATEADARDFKDKLAAKMVADIAQLERQLSPLELDIAFAFRGLIDLTNEQMEK